jgi:hypothetical protein
MPFRIYHDASLQRRHRRSRRLALLAGFLLGCLVQREEWPSLAGWMAEAEAHDPPLAAGTAPSAPCQPTGYSLSLSCGLSAVPPDTP